MNESRSCLSSSCLVVFLVQGGLASDPLQKSGPVCSPSRHPQLVTIVILLLHNLLLLLFGQQEWVLGRSYSRTSDDSHFRSLCSSQLRMVLPALARLTGHEVCVGQGGVCQELVEVSLMGDRLQRIRLVECVLPVSGGTGRDGGSAYQLRLFWSDGLLGPSVDERFSEAGRVRFGSIGWLESVSRGTVCSRF